MSIKVILVGVTLFNDVIVVLRVKANAVNPIFEEMVEYLND